MTIGTKLTGILVVMAAVAGSVSCEAEGDKLSKRLGKDKDTSSSTAADEESGQDGKNTGDDDTAAEADGGSDVDADAATDAATDTDDEQNPDAGTDTDGAEGAGDGDEPVDDGVLLSDDFNRADAASAGAAYSAGVGVAGQAAIITASPHTWLPLAAISEPNVRIEFDVAPTTYGYLACALAFRGASTDVAAHPSFWFAHFEGSAFRVSAKIWNSTIYQEHIKKSASAPSVPAPGERISVEVFGDLVVLKHAGVEVLRHQEAMGGGTAIGLSNIVHGGLQCKLDNLKISRLENAP